MAEKPILFNTEMVRAILDGRKTMTRRICKLDTANFDYDLKDKDYGPFLQNEYGDSINVKKLSPYQPGDKLYVRETWAHLGYADHTTYGVNDFYVYKANNRYELEQMEACGFEGWHPSIHMPKEAARIWLEATNVRVERLQEITEEDAKAEGMKPVTNNSGTMHRYKFRKIWDSTVKKQDLHLYGWDASPWVWVIEFKRLEVRP